MTGLSIWQVMGVVVGLAMCSVISRSFFFLWERPWKLPRWALEGLRHAPLAALAAVIAPDLLPASPISVAGWWDPRWMAGLVAAGWTVWRKDMLETIAVGMVAYLALRWLLQPG